MLVAYVILSLSTGLAVLLSSLRTVRRWSLIPSYVASSGLALLLLANLLLCLVVVLAWLVLRVFLGPLRSAEETKLQTKLVPFVLFKFMFCAAMIEHGIGAAPVWGAWLVLCALLKTFVILAKERLEFLLSVGEFARCRRPLALLVLVLGVTVGTVAYVCAVSSSMSLAVLLVFESVCIALDAILALVKWCIFGRANFGSLSYVFDLSADVAVLVASLLHYMQILYLLGVSFTLIDVILLLNMRAVVTSLLVKFQAYRTFQAMKRELQDRYPTVLARDIPPDVVCAICRDAMTVEAKQLPCTHLYHLECIRGWMEQNQHNCPLCRYDLRKGQDAAAPAAANDGNLAAAQPRAAPWFLPFAQPLEVDRVRDLERLREVFPQLDPQVIQEELERAGSIEEAIENLAEGRVFEFAERERPQQQQQPVRDFQQQNAVPAENRVFAAEPLIEERRRMLHDAAMRRAQ